MALIETNRLTLHYLTLADAALMLEVLNDPAFIRNIGDRAVRTLPQAENHLQQGPLASYQQHGIGMLRVARKQDGANIGLAGIVYRDFLPCPDLGYAFLPQFTGQGYAFEAAQAVYQYAKQHLKLAQIAGIVDPTNLASKKILEKVGLVQQQQIFSPVSQQWLDFYQD